MLKLDGTVKIEKMQYFPNSLNDIKEDDRELIVARLVDITESKQPGTGQSQLCWRYSIVLLRCNTRALTICSQSSQQILVKVF